MDTLPRKISGALWMAFSPRMSPKVTVVKDREETVDILTHSISNSMATLRFMDLTPENLRRLSQMTIAITDIERLSDHAENIIEYVEYLKSKKSQFVSDC